MTKKELPKMPEVDPDDGEVERHDAHYRLNPSGHKELVVQKKGEQDEETLNELAESLMEMAGDYEGLEDDDQFGHTAAREALRELFTELIDDEFNDPEGSVFVDIDTIVDATGIPWDESSYDDLAALSDEFYIEEEGGGFYVSRHDSPDIREGIAESYEGLEDADEFQDAESQPCDWCGQPAYVDSPIDSRLYAEAENLAGKIWTSGFHNLWFCCNDCIKAQIHSYQKQLDQMLAEKRPRLGTYDSLEENIAFGGPAPAMSPEQQGYQRDFRPMTPSAMSDMGPVEVAGDHEAERTNQDSPNNLTSTTAQAADGPERSRAKSKIGVRTKFGIGPRSKYISGNRGDGGDGLDYGATHSESFTGTAAIAIGTYDVLDNDDKEDTDTSESLMANKKILNEWEPKFAGGGDYDPGDYQMPSPTGDGVAERKPKKDKVGAYETGTTNHGKEWPRDHNETAAMCDVDDDGVEHKPQGGHESSVGEPTDGHQTELGHNWPDEAKNSGSGVAEPFEGNRWSDGGTLKGGSGQDEMSVKAGGSGMPSSGTITGTSGPQYGQPQEGKWSPNAFATMMEGDLNLQGLFDAYAADGREAVCVEDFQMLLRAHGSGIQIDEQSMLAMMQANRQFIFYEGVDANGPYWVPTPLAEGKPFPGAAPPFGSEDSDSDDDDGDGGSGKPWESGSSSSDDDCDTDCDDDNGSGKPWEESRRRRRGIMEGRRRPFSRGGKTLNEFQRRSPDEEASLYQGGITDDPTMIPPGMDAPGSITGGPLDDIPGDDFQPGLPGEFDLADPMGDHDEFEMDLGPGGAMSPGPGPYGMHNASMESCPECGCQCPGGESDCPECGAMMGGMGDEDIFGPGGMEPGIGLPSDIDDEDEYFSGGDYDDLEDDDEGIGEMKEMPRPMKKAGKMMPTPKRQPKAGGMKPLPEPNQQKAAGGGLPPEPEEQDILGLGIGAMPAPKKRAAAGGGPGAMPTPKKRPKAGGMKPLPQPNAMESRMYSPQINESLRNFMVSARSIIGRNQGQHVGAVADALNHSWDYYCESVDPNRCPTKVQNSLLGLMDKFPGFSPISEDNDFTDSPESKAMDSADGSAIGGGGSGSNKSSFLPDHDSDTKDEGEAWPRSHKQQNSPEETPIIKGTEKGMTGTGSGAKAVKENVARLSRVAKKCLEEGAKGLRGKYNVRFTCLVQESDGTFNRTPARIRLAEALADAEELLQIHPADQVVLESYFGKNGSCLRKYNIPMTPVKSRGPLISGDMALFRFQRTAEQYADNLVAEGITCRVGGHNWGRAVQVLTDKKKWIHTVDTPKTTMTESTAPKRKRRARRRRSPATA